METHKILLICLSLSLLLLTTKCDTPQGIIERATKQQIIATIPTPTDTTVPTSSPSQLFLASPSGQFEAYLVRRETAPGAGGFGNDFCYIQVQESGHSVWESECAPVSNVNSCTLVFSDAGLEIFDGSQSTWDTDSDGDDLETLELVDNGDLRIRDKDGEVAWKASDNPLSNQECGSVGAPGMGYAHAPFAHPIGGDKKLFGQPVADQEQTPLGSQQQNQLPDQEEDHPLTAAGQQPLVDNTPFDSGSSRGVACNLGVGLGILVMAYADLL